jgi:hypothetical protein
MRFWKSAIAVCVTIELAGASSAAFARGGYPMNSPGYQRRLQESRGYVTNRSGSIFATEAPAPAPVARLNRHHRLAKEKPAG